MNRLHRFVALVGCVTILAAGLLAASCGGEEQASPDSSAAEQSQDSSSRQENSQVQQSSPQKQSKGEQQEQQTVQSTQTQAQRQQQERSAEDRSDSSDDDQEPEQRGTDTQFSQVNLTAVPILNAYQFSQPIEMLPLPDGSLLVAEQRGYITRFVEEDGEIEQFGILDLTESIRFGGEEGLLSMALHPNLENEPYLYVYYSPADARVTRLSRFRLVLGSALMASELVIIEVPQPYSNHNGGAVRFGSDGMLYLGYGDGGAANDPQDHGQNRETLLGTIIRIDVNNIDTTTAYRIPPDNPFLGVAGVRPEIWAYGLRNPWRMAFDSETGDLWVGDVGQNRVEEVAVVAAGENHGWNVFEGDECFRSEEECEALTNAVAPVATYTHDDGCSVTGGEVYRGNGIPGLSGHYVFGDYCSGKIWTIAPDGVMEERLELDDSIASFAVDNDGEIYVLVFNGPILKLVAD
ncbi:MAG: PQQ-dependent sugar dehydrogenase [Chloroflexi bacterium]|nr:PQQ-dependent sugar dehydrogenase [Chloroflexota bacterium]